jgi:hypothetical protein
MRPWANLSSQEREEMDIPMGKANAQGVSVSIPRAWSFQA